jgi:hypothetical protein
MFRVVVTLLLVLGSVSNVWALRVLEQPESPFELELPDVRFPTAANGLLSFKTCDTCRLVSHQLATTTQYSVNGTSLPFADFLIAVGDLQKASGRNQTVFVGVFVDNQTQRVNRIAVRLLISSAPSR